MTRGAIAWAGAAALLCLFALLGWPVSREWLDWQPQLAFTQPWRALTAVAVHYSPMHLTGNLAGAVLTAAFGIAARVPMRAAWAWLAAWPLTHFALLIAPGLAPGLTPGLTHYGGLSGVLHAGVAIVIVFLLAQGSRAQRVVASLVLIGFCVKIIGEAPWGPAVRHPAGWDIPIAPIAHATGAVAGAACAMVALLWVRRPWSHH